MCYLQNELGAKQREVTNPDEPYLGSLHSPTFLSSADAGHWSLLLREDASPYRLA